MKLIKNISDKGKKLKTAVVAAFYTALAYSMPVHAAGDGKIFGNQQDINIDPNFNPSDAILNIIGAMVSIVQLVGVGATIWGIYSLYQCITQDRPEQRTKAIMEIAGGLLAAGGLEVLKAIGVIQ